MNVNLKTTRPLQLLRKPNPASRFDLETKAAFLRIKHLLWLSKQPDYFTERLNEQGNISGLPGFIPKARFLSCFFIFLYIWFSFSFCFIPSAHAELKGELVLKERTIVEPKVTLFAKTGGSEYYTLYPDGVKKEDAYVGGFKSTQLDPQEENLYFYDSVLKVIAKINLQDEKVYKVIGKPKNNADVNYATPVKFSDANLSKLVDFSFDKYGNVFILTQNSDGRDPRLLKASLKDQTITEVVNFEDRFKPAVNPYSLDLTFNLNGLSYDHDRFLYFPGILTHPDPTFGAQWSSSQLKGQIVLRYDPTSNVLDFYGLSPSLSQTEYPSKISLNPSGSSYYSLKGIAFDHLGICYLSTNNYVNSQWVPSVSKVSNANEKYSLETFIGDGTGSQNDIGDGGLAKGAYSGLSGSRFFCEDKNSDLYIADSATNRIRKVINESGLITTVIGGGTDSVIFGQLKPLKSVSLQSPNILLVDKSNNLYIVESSRILLATNLITHVDKPEQKINIANLAITKIAGQEIENPKGQIALPDLSLDYTYAGDQNIEVKGDNIPEGTNVKLLFVNSDGTVNSSNASGKLNSGTATIPVKIEAGATKVIKAETDPFIPAPGVYLSGNEPKTTSSQLPQELQSTTVNRNAVNLTTKNSMGAVTGNIIPFSARFNFNTGVGWKRYYIWDTNTNIKPNSALDPDNVVSDVTLVEFGAQPDVISLDNQPLYGGMAIFKIWMRTDSGNVNVPLAIGPAQSNYQWNVANSQTGNAPLLTYTANTVTPTWQQFSITSDSNLNNYNKAFFIGGFGQTLNQKVYIWGTRAELGQ